MKNTLRLVTLLVALSLIASLVFMAYNFLWGPDRIDFAGRSFIEVLLSGDITEPIIIFVVIIVFLVLELSFMGSIMPVEIKNGIAANARVLKVWDTGTTINDDPQVGLLLEISPAGGNPAFQAQAKTLVSRLNAAMLQPGITARVVYDPQNLKRVQILELDLHSAEDAASRLAQLEDLRSQRLISEEEYQQLRKNILDSL